MKKYYYLKIKPFLLRLLSFITVFFSLAVLFGEVTMFISGSFNFFNMFLSVYCLNSIILLNLSCVLPLIFLFICTFSGLFSFKLGGVYSMHNNQHTDSNSLLFLASFMCKVGFPLCINFVNMLKLDIHTSLEEVRILK